jgi:hypothetical protein
VAAKLGHQLSVIAWHDQIPLVDCVDPAHASSVAASLVQAQPGSWLMLARWPRTR